MASPSIIVTPLSVMKLAVSAVTRISQLWVWTGQEEGLVSSSSMTLVQASPFFSTLRR